MPRPIGTMEELVEVAGNGGLTAVPDDSRRVSDRSRPLRPGEGFPRSTSGGRTGTGLRPEGLPQGVPPGFFSAQVRTVPAAVDTTMGLVFLTQRSDELVGKITDIHRDDAYYQHRGLLIGRPVYIRRITTYQSQRCSCSIRAMVRREELLPGDVPGRHGTRDLELSNCLFEVIEDRVAAYTNWLRTARPGYGDLDPQFVFDVHADDETPKVERVRKKRPFIFRGLWKDSGVVFQEEEDIYLMVEDVGDTRLTGGHIRARLVTGRGHSVPQGSMFSLQGPINEERGHSSSVGRSSFGYLDLYRDFNGLGLFGLDDGDVVEVRVNE